MKKSDVFRYALVTVLILGLTIVTLSQMQKLSDELTSTSVRYIRTTLPLPSVTFCFKWYRPFGTLPNSQNWTFDDYMKMSKNIKTTILNATFSDQSIESSMP